MSSIWSSLLTALVAVAGIAGTAWGATADRRDKRRGEADALKRERLEDLYISVLKDASNQVIRVTPAATVVGDTPTPLDVDEELLRAARLEIFAGDATNAAWHELRKECASTQSWSHISRLIVQQLQDPQKMQLILPSEAQGMTHGEASAVAMDHWHKAKAAYEQLVACARAELNPRQRL